MSVRERRGRGGGAREKGTQRQGQRQGQRKRKRQKQRCGQRQGGLRGRHLYTVVRRIPPAPMPCPRPTAPSRPHQASLSPPFSSPPSPRKPALLTVPCRYPPVPTAPSLVPRGERRQRTDNAGHGVRPLAHRLHRHAREPQAPAHRSEAKSWRARSILERGPALAYTGEPPRCRRRGCRRRGHR